MTKERKAPKDWETWEDFANCYDLVLFNECVNINGDDDNNVYMQWYENHTCDAQDAQSHVEYCHETDCKECRLLKQEYGDCPECSCEPSQWYAIAVSEFDCEYLNKYFNLDIFYSDTLGIHILPVYHYGTAWSHVSLSMNKDGE